MLVFFFIFIFIRCRVLCKYFFRVLFLTLTLPHTYSSCVWNAFCVNLIFSMLEIVFSLFCMMFTSKLMWFLHLIFQQHTRSNTKHKKKKEKTFHPSTTIRFLREILFVLYINDNSKNLPINCWLLLSMIYLWFMSVAIINIFLLFFSCCYH